MSAAEWRDWPPEPEPAKAVCEHCGAPFVPRAGTGGKPQRFCSTKCRLAFHREVQRSQRRATYGVAIALPAVIDHPSEKNAPAPRSRDFVDSQILVAAQPQIIFERTDCGDFIIRQTNWPDDDAEIFIHRDLVAVFVDRLAGAVGTPGAP